MNFYNTNLSNFLEKSFTRENLTYRDKVFYSLTEEISKYFITEKIYMLIIKSFLKKNVLIYEKENILSFTDYQEHKINPINFEVLLNNIKDISIVFNIHNENNFMTDFILYIIKNIYDTQNLSNNTNQNSTNSNFSNYNLGNGNHSQKDNQNGNSNGKLFLKEIFRWIKRKLYKL